MGSKEAKVKAWELLTLENCQHQERIAKEGKQENAECGRPWERMEQKGGGYRVKARKRSSQIKTEGAPQLAIRRMGLGRNRPSLIWA